MLSRLLIRFLKKYQYILEPYIENIFFGHYHILGNQGRVELAATSRVQNALFNVTSGNITVEEYVFFGHNVCVLTGTHDYNQFELDRQYAIPKSGRDVIIKRGAWVASNVTVLGPCVIGEHSVIAAGSVVIGDVLAFTIVGGVPARKIRDIQR